MVKNVIHWSSDWQYAQRLTHSLEETERSGGISQLCLQPGGWACFRTRDKADEFLCSLSLQCPGKVIEHEWTTDDDCGSSLWQDGRGSQYVVPREIPEWHTLTRDVIGKVREWEAFRDFQETLASCWESWIAEYTQKLIWEHSSDIAANMLCCLRLGALSLQKILTACLNQLENLPGPAQDALAAESQSSIDTAARNRTDKSAGGKQDQAQLM